MVQTVAEGGITDEQRELVCLIVAGYRDEEIARRLLFSERTMYRLLERLMSQNNLPNRAALGAFAASRGWLPGFPPPTTPADKAEHAGRHDPM